MSQSFPYNLCDFNTAPIGCKSANTIQEINIIFAFVHIIPFIAYSLYPIKLVFHTTRSNGSLKVLFEDKLCAASLLGFLCNTLWVTKLLIVSILTPDQESSLLMIYIKYALSSDLLFNAVGGLALSNLVGHIVGTVTGSSLYDLYEFNGKPYDPSKLLKLIRLIILSISIILYSLWETVGLTTLDNYFYYRTITYIYYGFLVIFITPGIYWILISKIVKVLKEKYRRKKEMLPQGIFYLNAVKYATIFGFSLPLLSHFMFSLIGNTLYSNDTDILIIFQVISCISSLVCLTIMSFYPVYRSFPGLFGRKTTSISSQTDVRQSQVKMISQTLK
ncbi:hypothetical protein HDV04_004606 [Boothiomyces sp. JEL0838]|nr:hypothetical protein HDV04_004606 [Boothiomyces sp. JEL0838]